jgi:tetratricopeptide (TPR) repeat protein
MIPYSNSKSGSLFFLCLLLLFVAGSMEAQIVPSEAMDSGLGGNNSIVGSVFAPSGQRVGTRVRVRLTTMTRGDRITSADENGNFAFRGLVSGNYSIFIDKEKEYEPFTQAVDIIQMRGSPPQVITLNIRLKLKPSTDAKPAVVDASIANLPERGRQLYTKAQELSAAGDRKGAIEQFLKLTSEFPNFMFGFNELGVQYLRSNEFEKADEAFQAALKIDSEAFMSLMNRGIALVSMKRFDTAELMLRHARKIDDKSAVVHYFLGQALANLGKFDEAEKELTAAVSMGGNEMKEAHRILAIIYSSKGDKKRAAAELEAYLELAPHAPDADKLRDVIKQLKGQEPNSTSTNKKPS